MRPESSGPPATPAPVYAELSATLGVELPDDVYRLVFTHRSYAYENGGLPTNERLEFLGDSVLGLVVTESLYRDNPDLSEGKLAKLRASVVNMRALAGVARGLGLGPYILLGRGEVVTGGHDKSSILADCTEALIGAIYLEHGYTGASSFVHRFFDPLMAEAATLGAGLDWKTSLQERTAELGLGALEYDVSESGPDHAKRFTAVVLIGGEVRGKGQGMSKKEAEQMAAERAYTSLASPAAKKVAEAKRAAGPTDRSHDPEGDGAGAPRG